MLVPHIYFFFSFYSFCSQPLFLLLLLLFLLFPSETEGEGRSQYSAAVPEREICSIFSSFFSSLRRIKFMFASIHLFSKGGLNLKKCKGYSGILGISSPFTNESRGRGGESMWGGEGASLVR